jgi:hypothetical protein
MSGTIDESEEGSNIIGSGNKITVNLDILTVERYQKGSGTT